MIITILRFLEVLVLVPLEENARILLSGATAMTLKTTNGIQMMVTTPRETV